MTAASVCCERCPGAALSDTSRFARRRQIKAAVFQPQPPASGEQTSRQGAAPTPGDNSPRRPGSQAPLPYGTATGQIVDISPNVITIAASAGERRFALTADTTAWSGAPLEPSALSRGDEVVIRVLQGRHDVADRIWANIGRVIGTIMSRESDHLVVAESPAREPRTVVIPAEASSKIEVRFPYLEPGYLIDLLGVRRPGYIEGLIPATSQPLYPSDQVPSPRLARGRPPETIAGSAVWHEPAGEPADGEPGVCYPAIDPAGGCAEDAEAGITPGRAPAYRRLPYLAVGTALTIRNECTGIAATLPVTGCAPTARLFNDHCVTCRISPRGRIADLTLAGFVALGGRLEEGCFNATLTIGR